MVVRIVMGRSVGNTESFVINAKLVHGDTYTYNKVKYINKDTPVIITCKLHGDFLQKPHEHIRGCGCQKCGNRLRKSQTILYNAIKEKFPTLVWRFDYSPKWLGLQSFDIYNEKYNIAIEYDGKQHYMAIDKFGGQIGFEKCKERDKRKNILSVENNCHLFRIKYDYTNKDLENVFNKIFNIIENENS